MGQADRYRVSGAEKLAQASPETVGLALQRAAHAPESASGEAVSVDWRLNNRLSFCSIIPRAKWP